MPKIFIMHPGKANYPEITAYKDYFEARGVDVVAGTLDEYRLLDNKADFLLWAIMGFYPNRFASNFVIHDYRSLSVGGWAAIKDLAKRYFNARPDVRIFQNKRQKEIMGFGDDVPHVILPMGVPNWIFDVPQPNPEAEGRADFCYIGEMSFERGFDHVLDAFVEQFHGMDTSLLLVGNPAPGIHEKYSGKPGLTFAGAMPQREALRRVAESSIAVSYFPYHRPHCYQTPTKLLEYAALGKKIICNDSPMNIQCCEEFGINSIITKASIFGEVTDTVMRLAKSNNRPDFTKLTWNEVIERSNITHFLPKEFNQASAR